MPRRSGRTCMMRGQRESAWHLAPSSVMMFGWRKRACTSTSFLKSSSLSPPSISVRSHMRGEMRHQAYEPPASASNICSFSFLTATSWPRHCARNTCANEPAARRRDQQVPLAIFVPTGLCPLMTSSTSFQSTTSNLYAGGGGAGFAIAPENNLRL